MSKPPHRFLMIDTSVFMDLRSAHTLEVVGAAFALVGWLALGGDDKTTDSPAVPLVTKLSAYRWRKLRPEVEDAVRIIMAASEPRHRFGRPSMSQATRERIFERDGRVCAYCSTEDGPFHIDHRQPVSRGGSSRDDNLCVACAPCNFSKAASLVSEWNW